MKSNYRKLILGLNIIVLLFALIMSYYSKMQLENRFVNEHKINLHILEDSLSSTSSIIEIGGEITNLIINNENLAELFKTSKYNQLLASFEYNEEEDFFHLDKVEEIQNSTDIQLWKTSNITGKGNLDFLEDESSIKTKEIYTVLFLNEVAYMLNTKLNSSYWTYYTSLNEFISVRNADDTYVSSDEFKYSDDILEMEYITDGTYENHPNRKERYWSKPYIDLGGAGLIITASYPVDYKEEYVGNVSIDFIASKLSKNISNKYPTYLLDNKGTIIATNNQSINIDSELYLFDDVYNDVEFNDINAIKYKEVKYIKNSKVIASNIKGTPYVLYQVYPLNQNIKDTLIYTAPIIIALIMLVVVNIAHIINERIRTVERKQKEELKNLEKEQQQLDYLASYDLLTNVYNRRGLYNQIDKIKKSNASNKSCVMIVDIDYFKQVNDTYGHDIGDVVLSEVATLIKNTITRNDIVARYGGEEFIIILNKYTQEKGLIVAENLRKKIKDYKFEKVNDVTISIGLTLCKNSNIKKVGLKNADDALYHAKKNGRNRVSYKKNSEIKSYYAKK